MFLLQTHVLYKTKMVSSLPKSWRGDFNFEKFNSLNYWWKSFFLGGGGGGQSHKRGSSNNGNQFGHNSGQNNYHTFCLRKKNFSGHFYRKNSLHFYIISFKRTYVNCSVANFRSCTMNNDEFSMFMLLSIMIS